jgi:DNA-binding MarR family transcriptional regulator
VLAALYRSGPPYALSPGTLLRATLVTSGTMTNRVDRLAARGRVERHADRTDGRKVSVVLTAEGRAAAGSALGALLTAERAVLAALSPREAADLAALLRRLLSPFDAGHPTVTRRSHDLVPSDHLWPGVHPSPP